MSSMTTTDNKAFLNELARLVGHSHLLTPPGANKRAVIAQNEARARLIACLVYTSFLHFVLAKRRRCTGK